MAVKNALQVCEKLRITGKNVTPFVLSEVSRVTKGVSRETSKRENNSFWLTRIMFCKLFIQFASFRHFLIEE